MRSNSDYNFIFVAVTRTGSMAVRKSLQSLPGAYDPANEPHEHNPPTDWLHPGHWSASEWRQVYGEEDFNKRFKFTFVRNPWCKLVSHYTDSCRRARNSAQFGLKTVDRERPDVFNKWLSMMLNDHVIAPCPPKHGPRAKDCNHERTPHWNCIDWLTDENGNVLVDFIGRHENIEEDYRKILQIIEERSGMSTSRCKPLSRRNTSNPGHDYRWYYNDESIELIRKYYKRDIEEFGYEY